MFHGLHSDHGDLIVKSPRKMNMELPSPENQACEKEHDLKQISMTLGCKKTCWMFFGARRPWQILVLWSVLARLLECHESFRKDFDQKV